MEKSELLVKKKVKEEKIKTSLEQNGENRQRYENSLKENEYRE